MSDSIIKVRILVDGCGCLNRGEVAGFSKDKALRLIASGWAAPVSDDLKPQDQSEAAISPPPKAKKPANVLVKKG